MEFKDKLKQLRTEKRLSQQALADAIHVSRSAVAKWENGLGYPSQDCYDALVEFFQVNADYFRTEEPEKVIVSKNSKIKRLKLTLLFVAIVGLIICFVLSCHWITTSTATDTNHLTALAEDYLGYDELEIVKLTQRGNYLAALCRDPEMNWSMCVYDRDRIFQDRWTASGGKKSFDPGEIASWNFGSPQREAVLIFCGAELDPEIAWYSFENSGISYTCPISNGEVLDIFIILDSSNINGYPIPLDENKVPIS